MQNIGAETASHRVPLLRVPHILIACSVSPLFSPKTKPVPILLKRSRDLVRKVVSTLIGLHIIISIAALITGFGTKSHDPLSMLLSEGARKSLHCYHPLQPILDSIRHCRNPGESKP